MTITRITSYNVGYTKLSRRWRVLRDGMTTIRVAHSPDSDDAFMFYNEVPLIESSGI